MEEDNVGVQVQKMISSSFILRETSSWCAVLLQSPRNALTGVDIRKASAYESFSIYVGPIDLPKSGEAARMAKQPPPKIQFCFN